MASTGGSGAQPGRLSSAPSQPTVDRRRGDHSPTRPARIRPTEAGTRLQQNLHGFLFNACCAPLASRTLQQKLCRSNPSFDYVGKQKKHEGTYQNRRGLYPCAYETTKFILRAAEKKSKLSYSQDGAIPFVDRLMKFGSATGPYDKVVPRAGHGENALCRVGLPEAPTLQT